MADQLAGYWYRKVARKRGLIEKDKVDFFYLLERIANFFSYKFYLEVATSLRTIYKHNVQQFCNGKMGAVNG